MVVITSSLYPHHLSPKRKARAFVVPAPPPLHGTYPGTGREQGRQTDRQWIEWSGGSTVSKYNLYRYVVPVDYVGPLESST
eukprot:scaffold127940_cov63-Attheya_sp.AAC.1